MKTLLILLSLATVAYAQDVIILQPGQSITIKAASPTSTPTPTATSTPTPTPSPTATPTPIPNHVHIYDMVQPASAQAMANPNVDGGLIKIRWMNVEPREGQFDWRQIDNFMAPITAANKEFELALPAGAYVPAWAYNNPTVNSFGFIWPRPWVFPVCSVQKIPLPWDTNFISKYSIFIDAVAARYRNNPKLARVKLTGVNGDTDELALPHAQGEPIEGGQCSSNNDIANWQKAGYDFNLVIESINVLGRYIGDKFPGIPVDAMVVRWGFPSDLNTPSPGASVSPIRNACSQIPNCTMQNNGWRPTSIPIPGMLVYQEGSPMGTSLPQGIDLALSQTPIPHTLEIDDNDINIDSNQAALAKAHNTHY